MSEAAIDEIPYGDLGLAWWRETGEQVRATEQQVKLAACLFSGMTRTAAARLAGYSSQDERARKSGSEAAKTNGVKTLLALATNEVKVRNLPSAPKTLMTRDEAMEKLTDIARGKDPSLALRAIEAINKNEASPTDIGAFALLDDGFNDWRIVRDYLRIAGGAVAITSIYDGLAGELESMPLVRDVVDMLKRDNPDFYDRLRSRQSKVGLVLLDRHLADPDWQRAARQKLWLEVGVDIEAVGSIADVNGGLSGPLTNSSADALAKRSGEASQHATVSSIKAGSMNCAAIDHAREVGR